MITSAALSADGRLAVSGGWYQPLRLWDLASGTCLHTFESQKRSEAYSLSVTADFRRALSVGSTEVRLWDIRSGSLLKTFNFDLKGPGRVAMSRNGRCALIGGFKDNRLRLLNLKAGQFLATLEDEQQTFYKGTAAIAVSEDGQFGLSAPDRGDLVLWDLMSKCCAKRLGSHNGVQCVAFSPDARYAISASLDSTLRLWDFANAACARTFCGHTAAVRSVAIAPNGDWAVSGGDDCTLRLWDVTTGRCLRTLESHADGVDSVALSSDGRWALSASGKGALHLWDLGANLAAVAQILAPPAVCRVTGIAEVHGNKRNFDELLQAAKDANSRKHYGQCNELIRRARSLSGYERAREALDIGRSLARHGVRKTCRGSWQLGTLGQDSAFAKALAMSSDGRFALSAHHYRLMLWDVAERRLLKLIQTVHGVPNCLALSSDGKWGLSSAFECAYVEHTLDDAVRRDRLRLWKLPEGECVRVLDGHAEEITSVAISSDGKLLLSASEHDKTVRIWDSATGDCLESIDCEYGPVRALALSPDAQWALSLDKDGQIDHLLFPGGGFKGLSSPATSIALSPDGRHAASGNSDGTIQLWDADKGTCVGAFEGHTAAVNALAFSGDRQHLLSASCDGTVRLWNSDSGKCRQTMERGGKSIDLLAVSADAHLVLCGSEEGELGLWELDWEYDFPESVDWDIGAETSLKAFLTLRCQIQKEGWGRVGKPIWSEQDFHALMTVLQYRGYGWLKPEGVRERLERLTAEWNEPPKPLGVERWKQALRNLQQEYPDLGIHVRDSTTDG